MNCAYPVLIAKHLRGQIAVGSSEVNAVSPVAAKERISRSISWSGRIGEIWFPLVGSPTLNPSSVEPIEPCRPPLIVYPYPKYVPGVCRIQL
ncbi:MAG: hypothetical protein L0387_14510 [Acidobacteria bacterium]|nr:hypothetical protein [Acidobacteriota bacterium]MCI0720035.1 hypothetical protein [Acidobacteriota bacterium]